VAELRVPEMVEDPFREHYRALILGSVLRTAEVERELHLARGHRLRARRAERVIARLRPPGPRNEAEPNPPVEPEPTVAVAVPAPLPVAVPAPVPAPALPSVDYDPWFGPGIRRTALIVWVMTLGALVADVVVLGVDSYTTIGADLGLVAMTFILFFAYVDDLTGPR
jgi:hypothetical protein